MPIRTLVADITTLPLDAIVNAANPGLLGGGGVDGAIHRAAGPALLEACRALPQVAAGVRCRAGQARVTAGFALPARWIIHTVGPVWQGGGRGEAGQLESCYRQSLRLLRERGLRGIAFPAISCGVYGYPPARAATVAVDALRGEIGDNDAIDVVLCSFSADMDAIVRRALSAA